MSGMMAEWQLTALARSWNGQRVSLAGHEHVVADVAGLRAALGDAWSLGSGETVSLRRNARHYIVARRVEGLWAVTVRRGGFWTVQSFTAEMRAE